MAAKERTREYGGAVSGALRRRRAGLYRRGDHAARDAPARGAAMLRGKTVEMPPREHDNLPL
jgi:hypothetical protein